MGKEQKVNVSISISGIDSINKKLEQANDLSMQLRRLVCDIDKEINSLALTVDVFNKNASAKDVITVCSDK